MTEKAEPDQARFTFLYNFADKLNASSAVKKIEKLPVCFLAEKLKKLIESVQCTLRTSKQLKMMENRTSQHLIYSFNLLDINEEGCDMGFARHTSTNVLLVDPVEKAQT